MRKLNFRKESLGGRAACRLGKDFNFGQFGLAKNFDLLGTVSQPWMSEHFFYGCSLFWVLDQHAPDQVLHIFGQFVFELPWETDSLLDNCLLQLVDSTALKRNTAADHGVEADT